MILFMIGVFALGTWFSPWWSTVVLAGLMAWVLPEQTKRAWRVGMAAALVWIAFSYVEDAVNSGLVSQRLAGLFGLPNSGLVYLIMGFVGFLSAFLSVQSVRVWKGMLSVKS